MAEYRLHCFAQSGNSFKPALMLALAGADWEPAFVDFMHGAHKGPEYQALNEMGEAPVLEHAGKVISQSGVILDYLAGRLGRFGPRDDDERREILRWILWDNHKFTSYTATWRFLVMFVPEDKRPVPQVIEFLAARAKAAYGLLDRHLQGRDWIVGNAMTIADISCAGYMFFHDEIPADWSEYPNLTAWRERIRALPGWKHPYDLMPGHPIPA